MLSHSSEYSALTDHQLKLLGRISLEWSNTQFLLSIILSRLLFTPEYLARTYTDNFSAYKLLEAIREGIEIHEYRYDCSVIDSAQLQSIKSLVCVADEIRAKRNRIAHFCWYRFNDDEILGTNFPGGNPDTKKHRRGTSSMTNEELESIAGTCFKLVEDINALLAELPRVKEKDAIMLAKKA